MSSAGPVARWTSGILHGARVLVAVLSCLVIAGSLYLLVLFVVDPEGAEAWTVGLRPNQFFRELDHDQRAYSDAGYAAIFGVAHNSGGSVEATLEALVYGADIIEADVVELEGTLYSAHDPPLPFLGQRWFRGPRLDRIWAASAGATAVKLDLKESSPAFVQLVGDFLEVRASYRQVIVSSRSPWVLHYLHARVPEAVLLLSVSDAAGLAAMRENQPLIEVIDGITVRHTILDSDNVAWINVLGLLMFAWTVNDLERANELMRLGVDGITTDNLALISLFAGDGGLERPLRPSAPLEGQNE